MLKHKSRVIKILCMMLLLSFYGANAVAAEGTPKKQTLSIGAIQDFKSGREGQSLIFDTLVELSLTQEPLPGLAHQWEINENYTEFVLHIMPGVRFSDGTPLRGADIIRSLTVLGQTNYCNYAYQVEGMEEMAQDTIRIAFKTPQLFFLSELAGISIMKAEALADDGAITEYIGTGAYVLGDYAQDASASLKKNNSYWNQSKSFAVDEIRWMVISDANARKLALLSGQIDVIGISEHYPSVPEADAMELRRNSAMSVQDEGVEDYTYVNGLDLNWKKGALSDAGLRRAIQYTVNRKLLAEKLFFGEVSPCGYIYNPHLIDGPRKESEFTYNKEKALGLFKEAGYTLEGGKMMKEGAQLALSFKTGSTPGEADLAVFIKDSLADVGILVHIEGLESNLLEACLEQGDYDMTGGHNLFQPLVTAMVFNGISTEFTPWGLGFGVSEAAVEAGEAVLAAKDQASLQAATDAYWKALTEEAPFLPLYTRGRTAFYNKEWTGFQFKGGVFQIDLSEVRRVNE